MISPTPENNAEPSGRRSTLRYSDQFPVSLTLDHGGPYSADILNLSATGLSLALPRLDVALHPDMRVVLHLPFPFQTISARGRVRWFKQDDRSVQCGIELHDEWGDLIVLRDYLNRAAMHAKSLQDRRVVSDMRVHDEQRCPPTPRIPTPALKSPTVRAPSLAEIPEVAIRGVSAPIKDFPLLIGGDWVRTENVEYFPYAERSIIDWKSVRGVVNAAKRGEFSANSGEVLFGRYYVGRSDTNRLAMAAAHEAAREFRHAPLAKRHRIILDIHDLLLARRQDLIDLMVIEGHPVSLAEWEFEGMAIGTSPQTLEFYKSEILKEMGEHLNDHIFIVRRPDGVVCLSTPKNAPCSVPLLAVLSILVGNTVIVKPPLHMPLSCLYLWNHIIDVAARANGAPAGIVNTVLGNSKVMMTEWLESPLTNDIFFFGESATGLEIGQRAFAAGKKSILELSGNDLMLIWEDASLDEAVDSLVKGLLGSLQICMAPKNVVVHPAVYAEFVDRLVQAVVNKVKPGLPSDRSTYLTPISHFAECARSLEEALAAGAQLICGGRRIDHRGVPDGHGLFFEATVIGIQNNDPFRLRCVSEENFFPLLPLIRPADDISSDDDVFAWMIGLTERNDYALRVSAWTRSPQWASRFANAVSNCGLLRINSSHTGFSTYLPPNGGGRLSGGPFGEMNYPWAKTSHLQGVSLRW